MKRIKFIALLLMTVVSGLLLLTQKPVVVNAAAPDYGITVGLMNVSTNTPINVINSNLTLVEQGGYYYVQHAVSSYNTTLSGKPSVNWHSVLNGWVTGTQYFKVTIGNQYWPENQPIQATFSYGHQYGVASVSGSDNDMSFTLKYQTSTVIQHTLLYSSVIDKQATNPAIASNFTNLNVSISILKEDMVPVLEGEVAFITNVDEPITEAEIRSNLVAWDNEDGDISHLIQVDEDTYTSNASVVGTWSITYVVEDTANNSSSLIVHVLVKDITEPVITGGQSTYSIGYKETLNIETIRTSLTATDNYDSSVTITVKTNNYTTNKGTIGQYQVVFSAIDTSGNEATKSILVNVVDNVAPTISGPTNLSKPKNQVLTESQIRSQLSAYDEISGNRTANITLVTDNYTGKGALVGSYTLVYAVADAAGNQKQHTVTVSVIDDIASWWFMKDGYFISVPNTVNLTRQQIIDILVNTNQLQIGATTYISFLLDEYTGHEDDPGIYAISIKSTSVSGTEMVKNLAIQVTSGSNTGGDIVLDTPPSHLEEYGIYYLIGFGVLITLLGITVFAFKPKRYRRYNKGFRG